MKRCTLCKKLRPDDEFEGERCIRCEEHFVDQWEQKWEVNIEREEARYCNNEDI